MSKNFVDVINDELEKEELIKLLRYVQAFPEREAPDDAERGYFQGLYEWYNDIEYYDDKGLSIYQLRELLGSRIKKHYKSTDSEIHSLADDIVRGVAKEFDIAFDELMNTMEVEDEILKVDSKNNFPVYKLIVITICKMALVHESKFDAEQLNIAQGFIESLVCTIEHKSKLRKFTTMDEIALEEIEDLASLLKEQKRRTDPLFKAVLGIAWTVALSDTIITEEERKLFRNLTEIFEISDEDAGKIRTQSEENLEKIRSDVEGALKKGNKVLDSDTLSEATSGVASTIAVLAIAEASGFGLFLAATTTLKAIGLLFGVTFAFGTYTTLTTILGIITGPIGWITLPIIVATTLWYNRYFGKPDYPALNNIILYSACKRGNV